MLACYPTDGVVVVFTHPGAAQWTEEVPVEHLEEAPEAPEPRRRWKWLGETWRAGARPQMLRVPRANVGSRAAMHRYELRMMVEARIRAGGRTPVVAA
jgi:hypothetical protein